MAEAKAWVMIPKSDKKATEIVLDMHPLVLCKDCKHRPTDPENKGLGQYLEFPDDVCPCQIGDIWYSWMPEDNWFCADGERRESE